MSDQTPTVSVVVPLYNTERYIAQALDSILAQTFTDFEVVVVNDASTDTGPDIVAAYAERESRIRMVTQENRGLAGARNTGIRESRGRYIGLLDADDAWLPEKLARHVAHLDGTPHVGVSFAPSLFIDGDGAAMGLAQTPRLRDIDAAHIFCRNPVGNGSAAVLRRAALEDIVFTIAAPEGRRACWFDESFRQSEDIELWTRMAATTTWRFEGLPDPLTLYRVNDGGLSADTTRQLATWQRFRDKLAEIAPALVAASGRRAESYQHRYLARRCAIGGHGRSAVGLMARALRCHPQLLFEEPRRTLQTAALSVAATVLPPSAFGRLKARLFAVLSTGTQVPTDSAASGVLRQTT